MNKRIGYSFPKALFIRYGLGGLTFAKASVSERGGLCYKREVNTLFAEEWSEMGVGIIYLVNIYKLCLKFLLVIDSLLDAISIFIPFY